VDHELVDERWQTLQSQNAHVLATMAIPDLTDRLKEIQHPVLVFWGMEDHFCPVSGVWKILKHCHCAQAEIFNRCGHWVMTEYPSEFNRRCLDFLDGANH
jgi:4,5:9,10-diseco-3-hydroxy-5,9,17-trioxoandrosta-1(10),2-diene-4-oate hydrolase